MQSISILLFLLTSGSLTTCTLLDISDIVLRGIAAPFGTYPEFVKIDVIYDFIIIGGGAAGCVLANRLSENQKWKVLLLEAGNEENPITNIPLGAPYLSMTHYNWGYRTTEQEGVCEGMQDGRCNWPRGKVLGGSTVINYMIYNRGSARDYDHWAKMGNTGWSYNDIGKYFKRFENVHIRGAKSSVRGTNGEMSIVNPPWHTKLAPHHLQAAMEDGINITDVNGKEQLGISYVQAMLKNGRRFTSAHAFLKPIRHRRNLVIAKNAMVTKIHIDPFTKTARFVEFHKDLIKYKVGARKEIILSAGVIGSPQLLMLSGVGPKQHLQQMNITMIQDLPVGETLQDQVLFAGLMYLVNQTCTIVDYKIASHPKNLLGYVFEGKGPLTSPSGAEVYAFLNTRKKASDYPGLDPHIPDIEILYTGGGYNGDTLQGLRKNFGISDKVYWRTYGPSALWAEAFTALVVLLKPESVGNMRLKTTNPYDAPLLFPSYYSSNNDVKHVLRGIRKAQSLVLSRALAQFSPELYNKKFPGCVEHEFDSDQYWMCSIRLLSNNLHHQIGTCRMGPVEDKTAVVTPDLRVKGIKKLRVVDSSVMPQLPSGHITGPTFMIAEKAADIIKQTWT